MLHQSKNQKLLINYLLSIVPTNSIQIFEKQIIVVVSPKNLYSVVNFVKNHVLCQYAVLSAISCTDYPERQNRFELSYEIVSFFFNHRLRVKTSVNHMSSLASIVPLFSTANWFEREIWDLFGVFFKNHPDLRRILTDYGFQGHPLRKDFPLTGYVEVNYDEKLKRVINQTLEITQNFRFFEFKSPWSK